MCLSLNVNSPFTIGKTFIFKTAIFIAVLIACTMVNAQEYNNWLLRGGAVLNFDTSPATIICNEYKDDSEPQTVMRISRSTELALSVTFFPGTGVGDGLGVGAGLGSALTSAAGASLGTGGSWAA